MNWPDIYQIEYIVLTQLQADALVTFVDELAVAARAFVKTASLADILRTKPAEPSDRPHLDEPAAPHFTGQLRLRHARSSGRRAPFSSTFPAPSSASDSHIREQSGLTRHP